VSRAEGVGRCHVEFLVLGDFGGWCLRPGGFEGRGHWSEIISSVVICPGSMSSLSLKNGEDCGV
jgi:hypothetical protein